MEWKRWIAVGLVHVMIVPVLIAGGDDKDERIKAKHRRIAEEADFFFSIDDHFMSKRIYTDLVELYPENAEFNFRLGFSYLHLRNLESQGIPYLEKAVSEGFTPAYYFLAEVYHLEKRFPEALKVLRDFATRPDRNLPYSRVEIAERRILKAMELLASPIDVRIKKLGSNINSDHQDYAPNIDPEGEFLYFTSRRPESTGGYTDQEGQYFEDIFMSHCVSGAWTDAEPVSRPLNSDGHDANVNFSASGNSMLIYRTHKNLHSGDLYVSERMKGAWSEPEKLDDAINTSEFHEPSAAFSPDERELYVVSDRPGGFGGKDIYVIRRLPNGDWSEPQNLGMEINSPFDEDAPFLSLDGRTMYFSSNGNGSIGGYDIFRVSKDPMGGWGEPMHMGFPVNSVHDDIYFSVTADGKRGFLSSSREGSMDIFEVDLLYEEDDLVVLKGSIKDAKSGEPIVAQVRLIDLESGLEWVTTKSNRETGNYVLAIRPDTPFQMVVEAMDYKDADQTVEIEVREKGDFHVKTMDVLLERF